MGSQGISRALCGCSSPLGRGTPACLALQCVLVLGTSCPAGWWPVTRCRAGWLPPGAGEGAAPSSWRLGPESIIPSSCRPMGRQDMASIIFGRGWDKECQNAPRSLAALTTAAADLCCRAGKLRQSMVSTAGFPSIAWWG